MAPIGLSSLLMGKALIGVFRGVLSSVAFLILALLIAPSMHVSPMFLLGLLLTCLTFSFLGVLAALLARSHEDMGTFGSIILLPMTFLGGTFFSLSQVPLGLKYLLYLLPLTHASLWLRAAALNQSLPWTSLLVLLIFFAAFMAGSMAAVKRMSI
ncbi:MAG: ABC-2 type transporter [Methanosaeta sp. PtaU1.Bin060]|nr:MAG: ABC-2 type transporter [Methanosaeta sp. PtaU1.Bin060]